MNKQRGFTLIELLIVLAILAILIGIVAMSIGNLRQTAMERGMQAERETVETAINSYVTLDDDTPADENNAAVIAVATQDFGKYLKKDSKYFYTWEYTGLPNQNVVVWNTAFADADFCTAADTIGADVVACDANACYQGDTEITGAALEQVGWDLNGDGDYGDAGETFTCS